jgi:hypothetical protein
VLNVGKRFERKRHVRGRDGAIIADTISGQSSPPSLETMTPVSQEGTCARFSPLASAHPWTDDPF